MKNGKSRDTGNIRHRTKNKDKQNKNITHKAKTTRSMDPSTSRKPGFNQQQAKSLDTIIPCQQYNIVYLNTFLLVILIWCRIAWTSEISPVITYLQSATLITYESKHTTTQHIKLKRRAAWTLPLPENRGLTHVLAKGSKSLLPLLSHAPCCSLSSRVFKLFWHNEFFWMTFREMYWHGQHDD
jgi:hypothetical protein